MKTLTSKQRAALRGAANTLDPVFQVGKGEIGPAMIEAVGKCLAARELIKLRALETCPTSPRETAQQLAQAAGAEVVQVVGTRFVLYRANPEKPVIRLD